MDDEQVRSGIRAFDSVFGNVLGGSINLLIGRTDLNFRIVDRLAVWCAISGDPVYYVDGAGRSNPFTMAQVLRMLRRDPYGVLSRINIARAFTAHQMDALVREALPSVRPVPSLAIVSGIDSLFSDAEVKDDEAMGMLQNCVASLEDLSRAGAAVLIAATGGSRGGEFLRVLGPRAGKWASLKERPGGRIRIVVKDGRWIDFVPISPFQTVMDDFEGEAS
jgi:hypothetical protein